MRISILAVFGLLLICVAWILGFVLTGFGILIWGMLILGAALTGVAVIADYRRFRSALVSRRGRFGLGSSVRIVLFVGIILVANAISLGNNHRFDFTGLAQFTLTTQTRQVLADLDTPVEIISFFAPTIPVPVSGYASNLLSEYQNYTDQLTVRMIDPELHPDQARQYGVDRLGATYGVVVFRGEAGQRQVFGPQISGEAEYAFTSALLEVTGIRQKRIYFLTGHGESSIYSDYSRLRVGLHDNLFDVEELDLRVTSRIPDDASVLVVAGPQQQLSNNELGILKDYMANGGRMFVLVNPNPPQGFTQLLSDWWMDIDDGTIIDPVSYVAPSSDTPLIPRDRNSIDLAETYFPGATAILPQEAIPDTFDLSALVWTSSESWLDKDLLPGDEPVYDELVDRKGPLAIGAVVLTVVEDGSETTGELPEARLVVIGDSDFAANQHYPNGSNGGLFLNAVNWLAAGTRIVSVDRKILPVRRLILSPPEARFLHLSSILLLPLLLLLAGGYVWWRKR